MRKFAALLIVLGLLAGGVVLGWHWYQSAQPEYGLQQGRLALERGDRAAAWSWAVRLEKADQRDRAALLQGEILLAERQYAPALQQLSRIEDRGELWLQATALSGRCHLNLGQYGEAARVFTLLLRREPDSIDGHRGLAAVYFDQGLLMQAVQHCQRWAELDDHDGRPHRFLGLIFNDLSEFDSALTHYQKALQRNLKPFVQQEVRQEMADCYLKSHRFSATLEILQEADPAPEQQSLVLVQRAEARFGLGETDRADELVRQAQQLQPDLPRALRLRGQLALQSGDAKSAARLLEKAVQAQFRDYTARHLLAQAYTWLGKEKEAAQQRQQIAAIQKQMEELTQLTRQLGEHPAEPAIHQRMAELYTQLDMPELAARCQRVAAMLSQKE